MKPHWQHDLDSEEDSGTGCLIWALVALLAMGAIVYLATNQ